MEMLEFLGLTLQTRLTATCPYHHGTELSLSLVSVLLSTLPSPFFIHTILTIQAKGRLLTSFMETTTNISYVHNFSDLGSLLVENMPEAPGYLIVSCRYRTKQHTPLIKYL